VPKAGFFAMVFQKTNWSNIKTFILTKFTANEMDATFGAALAIKDRNDVDNGTGSLKEKDKNDEYYISFTLFVRGFDTSTGDVIPVEFDLGIHFFGKKDNSTKEITTIFVDDVINQSLGPAAIPEADCLAIRLLDPAHPSYDTAIHQRGNGYALPGGSTSGYLPAQKTVG
jgi:hypothetical protein